MRKAKPTRPAAEITQPFNDGVVRIYTLSDAETGGMHWPVSRGCRAFVESLMLGYKALEVAAIHAFADEDEEYKVITSPENFQNVVETLEKEGFKHTSAELTKLPQNTLEITAVKEKCDSTFQYICTHIRNQARNPNKNRQKAAERLEYVISPFKNVSRETMLGASGAYYKFLASMQQENLTADVKLLDLDEPLAILQADLETFNELFQARSLVKLENIHEPMREIRRQVDETFRAWATFVNSLYCVNYYLDQDAVKAQELLQLINKVNGILNETGETLIRLGHAYKPVSKQKEKDKETEKDKEDKEKKEV